MNIGIRTDRGDGSTAIVRAIVHGVDHRIELPADVVATTTVGDLEQAVIADFENRTDQVTLAKRAEAQATTARKDAERKAREDADRREAEAVEDERRKASDDELNESENQDDE